MQHLTGWTKLIIIQHLLMRVRTAFLLFAQAIQQIARVTLFAATPCARGSRGSWESSIPVIEQTEELRFPIDD